MASVSSLDQDMRKLRLERYTPQAANEVRAWIEDALGEKLAPGDLMEALKDGVALCKLVNKAAPPGVKYKQSSMPFVQMENISNFLHACEIPPMNLPSHDRFLTVDLFDGKDPAQVLQCISAFSRRVNTLNASAFPRTIGAKSKGPAMSPQISGSGQGGYGQPAGPLPPSRERGTSNTSESSQTAWNPLAKGSHTGRISPTKQNSLSKGGLAAPGPTSSWSNKGDEGSTVPAWNIHQYGYMGGANAGNQGVAFGARRQIISAAPIVPSLAEKERRRKEEAVELERKQQEAEEAERRQKAEQAAEEERARDEEDRRWQEETRLLREKEKREADEEKRRWDEQQRQWQKEEETRLQEEREVEAKLAAERNRKRGASDARLNGQFLSQYQAGQSNALGNAGPDGTQSTSESNRIRDLERQLEEAKERERQYEQARKSQPPAVAATRAESPPPPSLPTRPVAAQSQPHISHEDNWDVSERDYLRKEWQSQQTQSQEQAPPKPPRPIAADPTPSVVKPVQQSSPAGRPLPTPVKSAATNYTPGQNRTDQFLSINAAPAPPQSASHRPSDYSTTTEVDLENQRRVQSQAKTKAGGWASKSLLEREMERERERQREWEEGQKQTEAAARDLREGAGPGQSWDVNQYGFMGGDNAGKNPNQGLGIGGARRQIIGPRPPP